MGTVFTRVQVAGAHLSTESTDPVGHQGQKSEKDVGTRNLDSQRMRAQ